jgi:hypothetical protein
MGMDTFAGIPGTIAADTKGLRWHRCDDKDGARRYHADVPDGKLLALVSRDAAGKGGRLLWHVSVSHRDKADVPDRCPNWDELKHAAYRLVPADVCFILVFPAPCVAGALRRCSPDDPAPVGVRARD